MYIYYHTHVELWGVTETKSESTYTAENATVLPLIFKFEVETHFNIKIIIII